MKGTLINTVAIILGTGIGLLLGDRYPEKVKETVMSGLGNCDERIGSCYLHYWDKDGP